MECKEDVGLCASGSHAVARMLLECWTRWVEAARGGNSSTPPHTLKKGSLRHREHCHRGCPFSALRPLGVGQTCGRARGAGRTDMPRDRVEFRGGKEAVT